MFRADQKELSVALDSNLNDALLSVTDPAADSHQPDADRRRSMERWFNSLPQLFNISIDDINALPADQRTLVTEELWKYFQASLAVRANPKSMNATDGLAEQGTKLNSIIGKFRDQIVRTVKTSELKAVLQPAVLKPRTFEFTAQYFTGLYSMRLADLEAAPAEKFPEALEGLQDMLYGHLHMLDNGNVTIANGHVNYSRTYYLEMRQHFRKLERVLTTAGLLSKPMLELMRKAGHDRVRDLVMLERSTTAPQITKALKDRPESDVQQFHGLMEAYVLSGRVSGQEAKAFDAELFRLEMSA